MIQGTKIVQKFELAKRMKRKFIFEHEKKVAGKVLN